MTLFKAFWLSLLPFQRYQFEKLMKKQLLGGFAKQVDKADAIDAEVDDEEGD